MTADLQMTGNECHEDVHTTLRKAICKAHMLLDYAAESGIPVDSKQVQILVDAERLPDMPITDPDRPSHLAAFWLALDELARAVQPVTVASLETSMGLRGRGGLFNMIVDRVLGAGRYNRSQTSIFTFSTISLFVLVTLLAVQIYWVIGSRLDAQSTELIAKAEDLRKSRDQLIATRKSEDSVEWQRVETDDEQLGLELQIRVEALNRWNRYWKSILDTSAQSKENRTDTPVAAAEPESPFTMLRKAKLEASLAKECIELYLLPLLYGLLGGCLYVLRTLAAEIKAKTFTADRVYGLRIYTGGLAGLVVAWFGIGQGVDETLTTLTPFALALLAGYSVELLFAFMDRLVSAFTGK